MRPLYSRFGTTMQRVVWPAVFAVFGLPGAAFGLLNPYKIGDSYAPGILISLGMIGVVVAMFIAGQQYAYVWLKDGALAVQRREGIERIRLANVSVVTRRFRPTHLEVRYNVGRVSFIPVDAGIMRGSGKETLDELQRLIGEAHRQRP